MKKIIRHPFFPLTFGALFIIVFILYMLFIDADGVIDKDAAMAIILFYVGAAYMFMGYSKKIKI